MKLKYRIIVSILLALLVISPRIVFKPVIIEGNIYIATFIIFIAIFTITSLFNVQNRQKKITYFIILGVVFLYLFYKSYYLLHWGYTKSMTVNIVAIAIVSLIFRGFSMLSESSNKGTIVYSVTDSIIADKLINLLSNKQIEAYAVPNTDGFLGAATSSNINIMLKDKSTYDRALNEINHFFNDQSKREPWECPQCNELLEGSFSACWNCGYEQE
ncbi:hypothetical protein [Hydrogenimonas sp.]